MAHSHITLAELRLVDEKDATLMGWRYRWQRWHLYRLSRLPVAKLLFHERSHFCSVKIPHNSQNHILWVEILLVELHHIIAGNILESLILHCASVRALLSVNQLLKLSPNDPIGMVIAASDRTLLLLRRQIQFILSKGRCLNHLSKQPKHGF